MSWGKQKLLAVAAMLICDRCDIRLFLCSAYGVYPDWFFRYSQWAGIDAVRSGGWRDHGRNRGYPEVSDQADGTVFLWVYTECDSGTCYLRNFFLSSSDSIGKSRGSQNHGCFACKPSARYLVADDPVWKRISGNSSGEIYKTGSFPFRLIP